MSAKSNSYRDLVAWQQAIELVVMVYEQTKSFPDHEKFGLTSQIRRAAVSVASNIAEGQGRGSPGEFRQFLGNAKGSIHEVETQLVIAEKLKYVSAEQISVVTEKADRVARLINGLTQSLKTKAATASN
jgi:four helix bundle protein